MKKIKYHNISKKTIYDEKEDEYRDIYWEYDNEKLKAIEEIRKSIRRIAMRRRKKAKVAMVKTGVFDDFRKDKKKIYKDKFDPDEVHKELAEIYGEQDTQTAELLQKSRRQQLRKVKDQFLYYEAMKIYYIVFITFTFNSKTNKYSKKYKRQLAIEAMKLYEDFAINDDYGKKHGRFHLHALGYIEKEVWDKIFEKFEYKYCNEEQKTIKIAITNDENIKEYRRKYGRITLQLVECKGEEKTETEEIECERYDENGNKQIIKSQITKTEIGKNKNAETILGYLAKLTQHSIKVKQSYIGTRKGTEYQKFKKELAIYKKITKDSYLTKAESQTMFPALFPRNENEEWAWNFVRSMYLEEHNIKGA